MSVPLKMCSVCVWSRVLTLLDGVHATGFSVADPAHMALIALAEAQEASFPDHWLLLYVQI